MIKDPRLIPQSDLPLIVFSDFTSGLIEAFIKWRTGGSFNHVMFASRPGYFASQGNTYSEAKMERYMKKGNRLKFIAVKGLTPVTRKLILASIEKKLKMPFHKKMYDWVGIFGQAIGLKKLNTPGLNYCSEDVVFHLKSILEKIPDDIYKVIRMIPNHESPQGLNEYMKLYPHVFEVYGKWDGDDLKGG